MIILGIDPGLAIVGYGVIEVLPDNRIRPLDYGCIYTEAELRLPERLKLIYRGVQELFDRFHPDAMAMEELFFNKNVKTALLVGQARGAALVSAANNTSALYEYTPLQIKQAVVGYGRAEKHQVQTMVKKLLNLNEIPRPDDAADGLAVAICHAHSANRAEEFVI